jgi:hypothetical protein
MEFVNRQVVITLAGFVLIAGLIAWFENPPGVPTASTTQAPAPVVQSETIETIRISGTLTLAGGYDFDGPEGRTATTCWGVGGYSDIREGLQVVVRDSSSKILASTSLVFDNATFACRLKWRTDNVPRSDFYSIEIGRRGELIYSYEELESLRFRSDSTLGF